MTAIPITPTQSNIQTAIGGFLQSLVAPSVTIRMAQQNRISEPAGSDFIIMTPLRADRLSTNVDSWNVSSHTNTVLNVSSAYDATWQLDIHGPNSANNAMTISTLWRDYGAADFFGNTGFAVSPLYADQPRQMPFVNAEEQYELRWILEAHAQVTFDLGVTQSFADTLIATLFEADGGKLPNPPTFIPNLGILALETNQVVLGQNLGAKYQRISSNNTLSPTADVALAQKLRAAGFSLELMLNNNAMPPGDDATYTAQCTAVLSALRPESLNCQNELDAHDTSGNSIFYTDLSTPALTAAAYFHQYGLLSAVCVSLGLPQPDTDGISSSGCIDAYWYHLYSTGQQALADAWANTAMPSYIASDLPTVSNPGHAIFPSHSGRLAGLNLVNALIPGYVAAGAKRLNVHCYWSNGNTGPFQTALQWLSNAVGLPLTNNEMGQQADDPSIPGALVQMGVNLGMAQMIWYSQPGPQSFPPSDAQGNLNNNGVALKAAFAGASA